MVDIAAPGVCDLTLYPSPPYNPGDDYYATGVGTSFAAPLVSGAAALYIANHPGASPATVRAALLALAEPGPIPGDPDAYHEGILNVSTL